MPNEVGKIIIPIAIPAIANLSGIFYLHNKYETALAWKEAIIVPTNMLIWVTPDENILCNSFLKKFYLLSIWKLNLKLG